MCDNPECKFHKEVLPRWQTHEITIVVDGVPIQVQRYCRDCTDHFMVGPLKLPRPATITSEA